MYPIGKQLLFFTVSYMLVCSLYAVVVQSKHIKEDLI